MKKYIKSDFNAQTNEYYPQYANYKVVSWDDSYENDAHYFVSYHDALNYGNTHYNGCCDIEEI